MFKTTASFLFIGLLTLTSPLEASCGSASCPLDTRSSFAAEKGAVRLGYQFEFIDQDRPRIGTKKASVGEISGHHDEQRTINRAHLLTGSWDITDRWSLDLGLPFISRSHRHIHNHHDGDVLPEGWDFSGLGDLMVQARFAFLKPEENRRPTLSAILGGEFPTGKDEAPNADGDHADPGITPGSGSTDGIVGLAWLQHFSMPMWGGEYALMPLFFSVTYKANGEGHDDYRLGYQLTASAGATYPATPRLGLIGQVNLLVKGRDSAGMTSEEVEKTGGDCLYVSPGVLVRITDDLEWSTLIQIPVRQRVNEIQITSNYNLLARLSYKFRL